MLPFLAIDNTSSLPYIALTEALQYLHLSHTRRHTPVNANKINACFLLGACGDALGAPLEGIRSLHEITDRFGPNGLQVLIPHENAYGSGITIPAGSITDDTTMLMTTAEALALALGRRHVKGNPGLIADLQHHLWQGYLAWGRKQEGGDVFIAPIDQSINWSPLVRNFWFACGAGKGTIAALMQPGPGSLGEPRIYSCIVRGKRIQSPNRGCGGMMRVAPIGFLDLVPEDIFMLGCESAAITHGHPEAIVATGTVALLVAYAARGFSFSDAIDHTRNILNKFERHSHYTDGVQPCLQAIDQAIAQARSNPNRSNIIDRLPELIGVENPFLATPVLAQVVYAIACADKQAPTPETIQRTLALSANHSGDSDSVAAIAGNILGAQYGMGIIPGHWLDNLLQAQHIAGMANRLHLALAG